MEFESALLSKSQIEVVLAENAPKVYEDGFFAKDEAFFEGLSNERAPELTSKISEHLRGEGLPGSAEYIQMVSMSAVLDNQLEMIENGSFDPSLIEQAGLPVMVDAASTTPEMLARGQAVLVPDARINFLRQANVLRAFVSGHITKTVVAASDHYAKELTTNEGPLERIKAALNIKPNPYEVKFSPNADELRRLEELQKRKYASPEERENTFRGELNQMMQQRPGSIGLLATDSAEKALSVISDKLSDRAGGAVDTGGLRRFHENTLKAIEEELGIYPGYGTAIENRIKVDLSE